MVDGGEPERWVAALLRSLINDIKLKYLCRNKFPRIIFILMHGDDYVINTSSIRLRVQC